MSHIIIELKDQSRHSFVLELLNSFGFIEVVNDGSSTQASILDSYGVDIDPGFVPQTWEDIDEGYAAMAADEEREREAREWMDGTIDVV